MKINEFNDYIYIDFNDNDELNSDYEIEMEIKSLVKNIEKNICFDFKNVDYISTKAVNTLIYLQNSLSKNDNYLYIINSNEAVEKILKIFDLEDFLQKCELENNI